MSTFNINFNVTGDERKRLVKAIAAHTQEEVKYLGVPSCAYQVGNMTIDKNGCVSFDDGADREEAESLIRALAGQGFTAQVNDCRTETDTHETSADQQPETVQEVVAEPGSAEQTGLSISLPLDGFNPDSLNRLQKLIDSKAALIKKALGAERLTVQASEGTVRFPWWDTLPAPEETGAYTAFLAALGRMAKEAKRVTATEKEVESEKYAFRGFLLRLGFIGEGSKQ